MEAADANVHQFASRGIRLLVHPDIIAIIDDDALVRESVQRLVGSLDYLARTFSSVDEFLVCDVIVNVKCIISDVHMVGSSAKRLREQLTAIGCGAHLIFMTALPSQQMNEALLGAGAICVLAKPFRQNEIARCIATALEQPNTEPAPNVDGAAA